MYRQTTDPKATCPSHFFEVGGIRMLKVNGYTKKGEDSKRKTFCLPFPREKTCRNEFASLAHKPLSQRRLLLKGRICSQKEQILSFKNCSPFDKGDTYFQVRVIFLGIVSLCLKPVTTYLSSTSDKISSKPSSNIALKHRGSDKTV